MEEVTCNNTNMICSRFRNKKIKVFSCGSKLATTRKQDSGGQQWLQSQIIYVFVAVGEESLM
jgi:hypothetical protein